MKIRLGFAIGFVLLAGCASKPSYIAPQGVELTKITLVAPESIPRALNFDIFPKADCTKENGKFAAFFFRSDAPREKTIEVAAGNPVAFDVLNWYGGGEFLNSGNSCRDRIKFTPFQGNSYRLTHQYDSEKRVCSVKLEEISSDGKSKLVNFTDPGNGCMLITK